MNKKSGPWNNKDWLYKEHVEKERTLADMAEPYDVTPQCISNWMKRFEIPIRINTWTKEEIDILVNLSKTMTLKEINDSGKLNKTYGSIRQKATSLGINSIYDPAIRYDETRKKISCTLQGINLEEFTDFTTEHTGRYSTEYSYWRETVFARDDYTCQKCRCRGVILNAHHRKSYIKYESLRLDVENGITLCEYCHRLFHSIYGLKNFTEYDLSLFLGNAKVL